MKLTKDGHAAREEELRTTLGEITLINCPVPTSTEDHGKIKNLLVVKKAELYVIGHPNLIKVVIKGLPTSTDIADIESELKEKGLAVEKVAQLRTFRDKSPPIFMVELKAPKKQQKSTTSKNLITSSGVARPISRCTIVTKQKKNIHASHPIREPHCPYGHWDFSSGRNNGTPSGSKHCR
ncbi:uncharacterized protein TNCV_3739841 [Trichonephila clavipes]|nr:uncharacterized protein TNCV_3739841 [Trichonephila clavipes]